MKTFFHPHRMRHGSLAPRAVAASLCRRVHALRAKFPALRAAPNGDTAPLLQRIVGVACPCRRVHALRAAPNDDTAPLLQRGADRGFSLIEVTIALGIIGFALVAVVGLLPAGLNSQKQGFQQAQGAQVLNQIARSVQGVWLDTNGTLKFLPPLSSVSVAAGTTPELGFFRDGTIAASNPSGERLGAVHVVFDNSSAIPHTLRAVISVGWPASAQWGSTNWTKNEGSMDTVLFINLPQ